MASNHDKYRELVRRIRALPPPVPKEDSSASTEADAERLAKMASALAKGDLGGFSALVRQPEEDLALNREGDEDMDTAEEVSELKDARRQVEDDLDETDDDNEQ